MVDQDRRYPIDIDPSRATEGDILFDALTQDAELYLLKQRELGIQMIATLAERITQLDALKLVPQIPVIDLDKDDIESELSGGLTVIEDGSIHDSFGEFSDDEDETDSEDTELPKAITMPGIWVMHKDIDEEGNVMGIFLDNEGRLWYDEEMGESGLETETFYKTSEGKVHLEEYPLYFNDALVALREIAEVGLGVSREIIRREEEQRINDAATWIEAENAKYGGRLIQRVGNDAETRAFNLMVARIDKMRNLSMDPNSRITPDELGNILYHVLSAQEVIYSRPNDLEDIVGSAELSFIAGSLVSGLNNEIGLQLHALVQEMNSGKGSAKGGYEIRRIFQIPYQQEPDGKRFFRALVMSHSRRAMARHENYTYPDFEYPQEDFQTPEGERISPDEIRDWLLSSPQKI